MSVPYTPGELEKATAQGRYANHLNICLECGVVYPIRSLVEEDPSEFPEFIDWLCEPCESRKPGVRCRMS